MVRKDTSLAAPQPVAPPVDEAREGLVERAAAFDYFKTTHTALWDWCMEARAALARAERREG